MEFEKLVTLLSDLFSCQIAAKGLPPIRSRD